MIAQGVLILALCAGVSAGVAGIYMQGKNAGRNEVRAQVASAQEIAEAAADKVANRAAEAISRITIKHTTVRQELEREVLTREVFRDCRSGPDAVRLLNSGPGVAQAPNIPAGGAELPASSPAR